MTQSAWMESLEMTARISLVSVEVDACMSLVQGCEDYINLNYIAFSKILKKHDKVSTCPFRMPYLMKIQHQTFINHRMVDCIKARPPRPPHRFARGWLWCQ